uniref:Uncharacterized protein n=1 Tax=Helicotheca tamesis TaxID=374047 RepID=A0A7S2N547_9STRA|mmetsp:Transcript_9636/g.13472  ORF Transcript_9636/g.13472 Transcript_9636/m.13472 type:complete len:547 (+) Transcript_9636:209-1849(+)
MGAVSISLNVTVLLGLAAVTTFLILFQIHSSSKISNLSLDLKIQNKSLQDLKSQISELSGQVQTEKNQISSLHSFVSTRFNYTMEDINAIVNETQTTLHEEVQKVNEDVSTQNTFIAYEFAGIFAVLGTLVFLWHMTSHLRALNEPFVQRKILAILWMCPIYSVTSWLGLVLVDAEPYLGMIKDFYEAYCIYTFLSFLIAVLGRGDRNAVVDMLANHADHMKPPIRLFGLLDGGKKYDDDPRAKAEAVLHQCQLFAMQFVLIRPLTSVALVIANALYTGSRDYTSPQFYIILVINFSIFVAFSGLVKFYHLVREDLAWCNPFPKFLCIKGVVFMTFWQRMVITIVAETAMENSFENDKETREWIQQAQSFLVCIEMLFFAIAHCFIFPVEEWEEGYRPRQNKSKLGDNMALRDFMKDVKFIMKSRKARKRAMNRMSRERVQTSDSFMDELESANQKRNAENDTGLTPTVEQQEESTSLPEHNDALEERLRKLSASISPSASEGDEEEDIDWDRLERYIEQADKEISEKEYAEKYYSEKEITTNEII